MLDHIEIVWHTRNETYLTSERDLEKEVQNRVGYARSQGKLQVNFITLQHLIQVLRAPARDHPDEMILDHGYHGMGDASLFGR